MQGQTNRKIIQAKFKEPYAINPRRPNDVFGSFCEAANWKDANSEDNTPMAITSWISSASKEKLWWK